MNNYLKKNDMLSERENVIIKKKKDEFEGKFLYDLKDTFDNYMHNGPDSKYAFKRINKLIEMAYDFFGEEEPVWELLLKYLNQNAKVRTEIEILMSILAYENSMICNSLSKTLEFFNKLSMINMNKFIGDEAEKNLSTVPYFLSDFRYCLKKIITIFPEIKTNEYLYFFECYTKLIDKMDKPSLYKNSFEYYVTNCLITLILADLIYYLDEPSLEIIISFLKSFMIEDNLKNGILENKHKWELVFPGYYQYPSHNDLIVFDYNKYYKECKLYLYWGNIYLTEKGRIVFEKIRKKLDCLSVNDKITLVNSEWWIDNGYSGVAFNPLSKEIKENYIETAIYGTEPPIKQKVKNK